MRRRGGTRILPVAAAAADPRRRRGEGWNGETATAGEERRVEGTRERTRDGGMREGGTYRDGYVKEKGGHWGEGSVGLGRSG